MSDSEIKTLKVNACVGIISYFSDDEEIRNKRLAKLNILIQDIDRIFNVPIIIIAQNWKNITIKPKTIDAPIYIYTYDKLGITGARKELKRRFLESQFDYLIMLDDDSMLKGDRQDGLLYLRRLAECPGMYGVYKPHLLKLFAMSREMYQLIEFPDGGADDPNKKLRFFEDMYIDESLQKVYPNKRFKFYKSNLDEYSDSAFDDTSTWHDEVYSGKGKNEWTRRMTGDNTRFMYIQATPQTLLNPKLYIRRLDAELMPKKYKGLIKKFEEYNKAYFANKVVVPDNMTPEQLEALKKKLQGGK